VAAEPRRPARRWVRAMDDLDPAPWPGAAPLRRPARWRRPSL